MCGQSNIFRLAAAFRRLTRFTPGQTSAPLVALLRQRGGDDEASDMLRKLLQRNLLGDSEDHSGRRKRLIPYKKIIHTVVV